MNLLLHIAFRTVKIMGNLMQTRFNKWTTNKNWLIASFACLYVLLLLNVSASPFKTFDSWDWVDIIGEGGAAILMFAWLLMVLACRPAGKVTNYFSGGLLALFIGTFQDASDEFLAISPAAFWHASLESATLPLGMVLITIGLSHWRKEQISISERLQKRERFFREHEGIDPVTQLSEFSYLKKHLRLSKAQLENSGSPFALVLIDIDDFHKVNDRFGRLEGDSLLQSITELLILNLRPHDLICRYAGDRYAIQLVETRQYEANKIALELTQCIQHFAYRTLSGERLYLQASAGVACAQNESIDSLLNRAKISLLKSKESKQFSKANAVA